MKFVNERKRLQLILFVIYFNAKKHIFLIKNTKSLVDLKKVVSLYQS